MTVFLSLLLVGAGILFASWPLVSKPGFLRADEDSPTAVWERQKRDAYAAIKEAEFDVQMGKMSDDDFRVVKGRYRRQALAAIAAMERERGSRGGGPGTDRGAGERVVAFCPRCGNRVPTGAKFCGGCGEALRDPVP